MSCRYPYKYCTQAWRGVWDKRGGKRQKEKFARQGAVHVRRRYEEDTSGAGSDSLLVLLVGALVLLLSYQSGLLLLLVAHATKRGIGPLLHVLQRYKPIVSVRVQVKDGNVIWKMRC